MKLLILALLLCLTTALAAPSSCSYDEWWSSKWNKCYKKYYQCSQYDNTDSSTCNSGKDNMQCDWDSSSNKCYEANGGPCSYDEWWSSKWNKCYKKYYQCSQYDNTDSSTCNSGKDNMQCDWDSSSNKCYEAYQGRKLMH
jgi:hypothetical protein